MAGRQNDGGAWDMTGLSSSWENPVIFGAWRSTPPGSKETSPRVARWKAVMLPAYRSKGYRHPNLSGHRFWTARNCRPIRVIYSLTVRMRATHRMYGSISVLM